MLYRNLKFAHAQKPASNRHCCRIRLQSTAVARTNAPHRNEGLKTRRHQTIADYAAIALCPALIVLLVSSLVYFVVLCIYRGEYSMRIGYIWFMFILGTVAIARLSIQESRKYAMGYAAVLGLATFVVLSRFQTVQGPMASATPIVNLMLIALVWFLADRITFDCTLIDEDEDASGEGLLDGLTTPVADQTAGGEAQTSRRQGRQPGRTVLWLAGAALPIFGIGQLLGPQDATALIALGVYLFSTLSLLVATSFLGVRHYLRQRGVDMPANVTAAWLAGGIAMTAIILMACFLIPQPGKMLASIELPQTLESPSWLKPSRYGWGTEATDPKNDADGESGAAGTPAKTPDQETSDQGGADSKSDKSSGEAGGQKEGSKGEGGKKPGGQQKAEGESKPENETTPGDKPEQQSPPPDEKPSDDAEQQSSESQPPPQPPSSMPQMPSLPAIGGFFKAIVYLVLIGIIAAFVWLQRDEIAKAWQSLLAWLRGERTEVVPDPGFIVEDLPATPPIPFSSFRNPIGKSGDPRQAVIVTYQAAEAWWRERGQPRHRHETPQEFIRRLRVRDQADQDAMIRLTDAYNRIVFGNDAAREADLVAAADVWKSFRR